MRKLLVTDIDGTLAHGDHICDEVVQVCRELRDEGWKIIVATGRILASSRSHMRSVGALPQAIVYDGARIMIDGTGEELWGRTIPPETVEAILGVIWDLAPGIQVFGDEKVFCRPGEILAKKYFSALGVPVIDDLASPRGIAGIFRVIVHGRAEDIEGIGHYVQSALEGKVRAVFAGDGFLDILGPGVSKGAAMKRLLEALLEKDGPALVAAAGDHLNDLELLEHADIAITMEDAREPLRAVADIVLPPASEKGFSKILEPLGSLSDSFEAQLRKGRSRRYLTRCSSGGGPGRRRNGQWRIRP
jgi:Cof subfamily protein (haloacid dehalogenase superfamily)